MNAPNYDLILKTGIAHSFRKENRFKENSENYSKRFFKVKFN